MLTKGIILFLLCLFMPVLTRAQDMPVKEQKILVVYYSRTGTTKMVAEKLAKKFGADLEELIDLHKRTGLFGFASAGKDALSKKNTAIQRLKHSLADYDFIIIGGPTWASHITPAVRTFIAQNNFAGKKIALFGTCHFDGVEKAMGEAADLIRKFRFKEFPMLGLRGHELKEKVLANKIDAFYEKTLEDK